MKRKLIVPIVGLTVAVLFLCGLVISLAGRDVPYLPEDPSTGGERDTDTAWDFGEAGAETGTDPYTEGLFFDVMSDGVHVSLYKGCSDSVVIPSSYQGQPVTHVDAASFFGSSIRSVTIPDTVIKIGQGAFSGCHELESVYIPDGVKYVGEGAFSDCCGLESIRIPDTVIHIEKEVFAGCRVLESIHIPASVTRIEADSFRECVNLRSITVDEGNSVYRGEGNCILDMTSGTVVVGCADSVIPDDGTVRRIGSYAFHKNTHLTEIRIPASVEALDALAFQGCTALERVEGGEGLIDIGRSAFQGCSSLREITLHGKLQTIRSYSFESCVLLETVELPPGLESLGLKAFFGCTRLREVIFPEGIQKVDDKALGDTEIRSLTIPEGCTGVWDAVKGMEELTTVYLPSTLQQIRDDDFSECRQLEEIHFNGTKEQWRSLMTRDQTWMKDVESWTLYCTDGVTSWQWYSGYGMFEIK